MAYTKFLYNFIENIMISNGYKSICDIGDQQLNTIDPKDGENKIHLDPSAQLIRKYFIEKGFKYESIDMTDTCTQKLDLNYDKVPLKLINKFDVVTNIGTSEHIVNNLNVFRSMDYLCKQNGVMLNSIPLGHHFNHGFYSYNPQILWHLSRSNNYEIINQFIQIGDRYKNFPGNYSEFIMDTNMIEDDIFTSYNLVFVVRKKQKAFIAPVDVENVIFNKIKKKLFVKEFIYSPIRFLYRYI